MNETILQVNGLCKCYKHHRVLDHVNMSIQKGDIYGFVGKNGAGKTTLIRIISGLIHADEGDFRLLGIDGKDKRIDSARKKVCTMVESPAIYPDLTAQDNLKMQCMITGKSFNCIDELLSFVDLSHTGKSSENARGKGCDDPDFQPHSVRTQPFRNKVRFYRQGAHCQRGNAGRNQKRNRGELLSGCRQHRNGRKHSEIPRL